MADESKKAEEIQVVRTLKYDANSGVLSWTFGTLIFDNEGKFKECKTGDAISSIKIDPKPSVVPLWSSQSASADTPKPDA
jgi:hypothetical protein